MKQDYFIFRLKNSLFAIEARLVLEVCSLVEITRIQEAPKYILGIMYIHGSILPVMDLNIRFGYVPEKYHLENAIAILDIQGQKLGIIIEEGMDISTIPSENIDLPDIAIKEKNNIPRIVRGIAQVGSDAIMILNHDLLLYEEISIPESEGIADFLKSEEKEDAFWVVQSSFYDISQEQKEIFRKRSIEQRKKIEEEKISLSDQFAIVLLNDEYFGIPLQNIEEFSFLFFFTPLPNCPEYIMGSMNLRGNILTILDIRFILQMHTKALPDTSRIVVISVDNITAGIAVEDIYDIVTISPSNIACIPSCTPFSEKYIKGTALHEGKTVTLLEISEILKKISLLVKE
mgnify:CR=1 FL=1